MKVKNLVVLALITFLFGACNDDITDDKGGGALDGEAWLALSINSGPSTRAINGPDQENGKPDESNVDKVRVVLFNGFTNTSQVTNVADLELTDTGSSLLTESKAFKVSSKAKSILIIINPSDKLPSIVEGSSTFADVNRAITATLQDVIGAGSNSFMMTNASGLLEPQDYATTPGTPVLGDVQNNTETTATAAEATGRRLKVTVDRVVAKVRLYNSATSPSGVPTPTEDSGIAITFSDVNWGLNVTNKKFYPISERTMTFVENRDGVTTWSALPYMLGSYRKDPNYDDGTDGAVNPAITNDANGNPVYTPAYIENYNFADADLSGNTFSIDWKVPTTGTGAAAEGTAIEYCLENTQSEDFNDHAYTTQAVVRAKVYPSHYKLFDNTYQASSASGDWIKISNGYYTYTTLLGWIERELTTFYTNGTSPALTNSFNSYLEYLANNGAVGVSKITIPARDAGAYPDPAAQAAVSAALFGGTLQAAVADHHTTTGTGDSSGNVTYYKDGFSYYKIMLKHNNVDNNTVVNELGEFGVVRNSVYDITIGSIDNPGYPIIPKPDPETPDEENEYYLAVEITINPWTWYSQTENL